MKTIPLVILFTVALIPSFFSQPAKSGVYLSFDDYMKGRLTFESSCDEKNTIKLRETDLFPTFMVKHNGKKLRLHKDSVYAVAECGKPLVRFQDKACFYLAEKGSVWIFYSEEHVREEKTTVLVRSYFFCVTGSDKLRPLTVSNLKYAFPSGDGLQAALDAEFKTEDASAYDAFHRQFKINHILKTIPH